MFRQIKKLITELVGDAWACKMVYSSAYSTWRKLIKDGWWSGRVWVGECFFLVLAHQGSPRQRAVKQLCVYVYIYLLRIKDSSGYDATSVVTGTWKFDCSLGQILIPWGTCSFLKPMTDDPSSPSKKLVRETRTRNSVRMPCILARVFSRARNLFRVGHSSIPSEKLGVRWLKSSGLIGRQVMFTNKVVFTSVYKIIGCLLSCDEWRHLLHELSERLDIHAQKVAETLLVWAL